MARRPCAQSDPALNQAAPVFPGHIVGHAPAQGEQPWGIFAEPPLGGWAAKHPLPKNAFATRGTNHCSASLESRPWMNPIF